jgi:ATP-binding cassette, subfamily F, member 3
MATCWERLWTQAVDSCTFSAFHVTYCGPRMITITNLSKAYGGQVVFDGVSFAVNPGEHLGLIGRNGSGKTTLFRLILGEEEADSGTIVIPKGYRIGHLSQQISFAAETVLREAALYLRSDADGADTTYKAEAILFGLGFGKIDLHRPPAELSGGYQIRLNLAKVLLSEPDLLLLDEPTNYLDIVSIRWLTQFLQNWKHELILITHDRGFMDSVITSTMGIHRCAVRKMGGATQKFYDQILKEEEIYEQTRINEERRRKEIEEFIHRFRAQATRAKAVQSRVKALHKMGTRGKLSAPKDLDFQFTSMPFAGKWVTETRDLSFSYTHDGPPLIEGLTLAVRKRDRIGIIGKNGRGKTTLLNLLGNELAPTGGTISHHEHVRFGYFGQTNIDRLNPQYNVEEEITATRPDLTRGQARDICGTMMFDGDKALKKISVLSGGEKSRVLLGKLLVSPCNLLLLDEPTNHLDMESVDSLIEAVEAFNGAVLIATHSEMILHAVAERLVVFDGDGVSLFEGTYQDFLDRIGWEDEKMSDAPMRVEKDRSRTAERKDLRRRRAEIIAGRSRALSPLQDAISKLENDIIRLEEQIKQDNEALVRASRVGEGRAIVALSISIHEAKKAIETSFEELETLTTEHHARAKEFEAMLEELDL